VDPIPWIMATIEARLEGRAFVPQAGASRALPPRQSARAAVLNEWSDFNRRLSGQDVEPDPTPRFVQSVVEDSP
jgi:hypothetical protein